MESRKTRDGKTFSLFGKVMARKRNTLQTKLLLSFMLGSVLLLIVCLVVFTEVNRSMMRLDAVYLKNVELVEFSQTLETVHEDIEAYLTTKSSDSLEDYYRQSQKFREMAEELNHKIYASEIGIQEKNIAEMSVSYLDLSDETILAKRGRNVERYKELYVKETQLYGYIQTAVYCLNNLQFSYNSSVYQKMFNSLRYLEAVSFVSMIVVVGLTLLIMIILIRSITGPLRELAKYADEVADGNLDIEIRDIKSKDEVGIVNTAFIKMMHNIRNYIEQIRNSMEKERQMHEKELLMETHLKDAQLKYLQAQINPHFLFNSLNAGAQLAMMEDAEKTGIFIEKMADFFRYNVRKTVEDSTLEKELEAVDNYVYILNVRFSGDIHFKKEIDPAVEGELGTIKLPSMILQPIVENAVNHGIRNVEWEGHIELTVSLEQGMLVIRVRDNGEGMTKERIEEVLSGAVEHGSEEKDSTGIGLKNVLTRLELFYDCKGLLMIESEGKNRGTTVSVRIPVPEEEEQKKEGNHVSGSDCR